MIVTDVSNNQDTQQNFAYITQVKDDEDVTISLSWLTGSLSPRQSLSPEQSWILTESRTYHIQEHIIFKNISYSRTYHIQEHIIFKNISYSRTYHIQEHIIFKNISYSSNMFGNELIIRVLYLPHYQ